MIVTLHQCGTPQKSVDVATVEEASRVVTDWQDERGMGASDMGARHGEVHEGTDLVARISYNGRVRKVG